MPAHSKTNPVLVLGLNFAATEMELGTSFVQRGDAELDSDGPNFFEASVLHFKSRHFVWLDLDANAPDQRHGCDCPHFDETGTGCEHLWALKILLDPNDEDEEDKENDEEIESESFLVFYLLQVSESLRKNALVLSIHSEDGGPLHLTHETWVKINNNADILALRHLATLTGGWRDVRQGGGFIQPAGPWTIPTDDVDDMLFAMAATSRLHFGDQLNQKENAIQAEPGDELDLALHVRTGVPSAVRGLLLDKKERLHLSQISALLPGNRPWVVVNGKLAPVRCFGGSSWARTLRSKQEIPVANGRPWQFLDELSLSHPLPRLVVDQEKHPLAIVRVNPRYCAEYAEKAGIGTINASFVYGDTKVEATVPGELCLAEDHKEQYSRDRSAEADCFGDLLRLGFDPESHDPNSFVAPTHVARNALVRLIDFGWDVKSQGLPVERASTRSFHIESGEDWFSLGADIQCTGEELGLAQLLRNFNPDSPWVQIDQERAVLLDEASTKELAKFAGLSSFGADVEGGLVFSQEQALLAQMVMGDQDIPGAPALQEVRNALEAKLADSEAEPAPSFRGELRPYQKAGLAWMSFLRKSGLGGCLADEMGLGKTVQVLAFLEKLTAEEIRGAFLIIAPLSLLGNWQREAERFCPDLRVRHYHGAKRSLDNLQTGEVILTSYGVLRRDAEKLSAVEFEACILDEAQAIKNVRSKTRAAAMQLKGKSRIALSGTPLENRLDDLWSLFQFLNPSLFTAGASLQTLTRVAAETAPEKWRRALRPLLLRREKEEVATDLPELTEQTIIVAMSDAQAAIYRNLETSLRAAFLDKETKKSPALMLEGLLRLRQAACHPELLPGDNPGKSGKIELLLDHVDDAFLSRRKCLVFSQFVGLLDLVDRELTRRGLKSLRLDGRTKDRQVVVDRFQDSVDPEVMLVSLKVGGTGLNLTAAEVVFLLDPWWNPAIESQAVARAHRIGQEKRVHAIRLVSDGTIEERILRLQEGKRELADSIMEAAPKALAGLSTDDLAALLGG